MRKINILKEINLQHGLLIRTKILRLDLLFQKPSFLNGLNLRGAI